MGSHVESQLGLYVPDLERQFGWALDGEGKLAYEYPLGWQARWLWEATFAKYKNIDPSDIRVLPTGIGGAPGENSRISVHQHKDGAQLPPYVDLEKTFGKVPKVLILTASPILSEHVIGLTGLARTYKEQGVEKVIAEMTGFPHERQDHIFYNEDGEIIREVTTLKDVINAFSGWHLVKRNGVLRLERSIDAAFVVQPHSLRSVDFALRQGFPLIPIDPFDFVVANVDFSACESGYILGPDRGRKGDGKRLAQLTGFPFGSAKKTRDRSSEEGKPTLVIDPEILAFIEANDCWVYTYDDEVRDGGTTGKLAGILQKNLILIIVKPIITDPAVERLSHQGIVQIITTDAVRPLANIDSIRSKMVVLSLGGELEAMNEYLRHHLVEPTNPNWMDPSESGTLLRLHLGVEEYE